MSYICFIQAAEYRAAALFLPAPLWTLAEVGRVRADEGLHTPLFCEKKASIFKRRLLRIISGCAVDPAAAVLALLVLARLIRLRSDVRAGSNTTLQMRLSSPYPNSRQKV